MVYQPRYTESHALIIGINQYSKVSPLGYAVSDAEALAQRLEEDFSFKGKDIRVLLNEAATKENILSAYLSFAKKNNDPDARILFFFAGHGETLRGNRGEIGYLIPHDGDPEDLSTLIRWDELTRNADLIPAKHILYIMDACYGGLAVTRSVKPGSMRFLKDMLMRRSRQVLTAGKADEMVADQGGPLAGHSVFTGHLLEGLGGDAASQDGVITANRLMAYVYERVGRDESSFQTPHFGYFDGDGDFVFTSSKIEEVVKSEEAKDEILVSVPYPSQEFEGEQSKSDLDLVKDYLSDPTKRIKLHDLVVQRTREIAARLADENFPLDNLKFSEFPTRLARYEEIMLDFSSILSLIAIWGPPEIASILEMPFKQLAARIDRNAGSSFWVNLKWYPLILLTYMCGLGATHFKSYRNLYRILNLLIPDPRLPNRQIPLVLAMHGEFSEISNHFKELPDVKGMPFPKSEYLYKLVQPELDDLVFVGKEYDVLFDKFEILFCLEHAHLGQKFREGGFWGPFGRFVKKQRHLGAISPFMNFKAEAIKEGASWAPLEVGFFDGSIERFEEVFNGVLKQLH